MTMTQIGSIPLPSHSDSDMAAPHINFTSLKDIQDPDEQQKDVIRNNMNDNAQIIDVKRLIELKSGKVNQ